MSLEGANFFSTLWPVVDVSTKLLVAEFYRLHLAGSNVTVSLRDAQRWLSRSSAETLNLAAEYRRIFEDSEGMDIDARDRADYYESNPEVIPFSHPFYWAAFTATGAC
jgi:CHAT domain-containing protein